MSDFRPGAIGTLTGFLNKVEFKTSRAGKRWATFELKRGKNVIRMKSFAAGVVSMLESFVEGEEVSVFGKLSTEPNQDGTKFFTNFTGIKLYDGIEDDNGITVRGECVEIKEHQYGHDVTFDVTEDENYPTKVTFQVSKGVRVPFEVGGVYQGLTLEPKGKFAIWTLETGIAAQRDQPTEHKGKKIVDMSEASYERDSTPAAEKPVANNTYVPDDDIPF